MIGIWWPVFAFVSLGLDHVVANMFFIPMGIWLGTPNLDVGLYIWKGMIPALFGNILGGSLFCGAYYWWMYLLMAPATKIDGVEYQGPVVGHGLSFLGSRAKKTPHDEESSPEQSRKPSQS